MELIILFKYVTEIRKIPCFSVIRNLSIKFPQNLDNFADYSIPLRKTFYDLMESFTEILWVKEIFWRFNQLH